MPKRKLKYDLNKGWIKTDRLPDNSEIMQGFFVRETTGWVGIRNYLTSQTTHWLPLRRMKFPPTPKD